MERQIHLATSQLQAAMDATSSGLELADNLSLFGKRKRSSLQDLMNKYAGDETALGESLARINESNIVEHSHNEKPCGRDGGFDTRRRSLCRPWNHEDFMLRLRSFAEAPVHHWFAKPALISAVECALHGWWKISSDDIGPRSKSDTVYCFCCGVEIRHNVKDDCDGLIFRSILDGNIASFAAESSDGNSSSHGDSNNHPLPDNRQCGHLSSCGWHGKRCDESFADIIHAPLSGVDYVNSTLSLVSSLAARELASHVLQRLHTLIKSIKVVIETDSAGHFRRDLSLVLSLRSAWQWAQPNTLCMLEKFLEQEIGLDYPSDIKLSKSSSSLSSAGSTKQRFSALIISSDPHDGHNQGIQLCSRIIETGKKCTVSRIINSQKAARAGRSIIAAKEAPSLEDRGGRKASLAQALISSYKLSLPNSSFGASNDTKLLRGLLLLAVSGWTAKRLCDDHTSTGSLPPLVLCCSFCRRKVPIRNLLFSAEASNEVAVKRGELGGFSYGFDFLSQHRPYCTWVQPQSITPSWCTISTSGAADSYDNKGNNENSLPALTGWQLALFAASFYNDSANYIQSAANITAVEDAVIGTRDNSVTNNTSKNSTENLDRRSLIDEGKDAPDYNLVPSEVYLQVKSMLSGI